MILSPDQIKQRLKNLGVGSDKFLGQHFLIDATVLEAILAKMAEIKGEVTLVVEVGPGLGVLTRQLAEDMSRVIAIEKDPIFARALPDFLGQPNVDVRPGDALRVLETDLDFPHEENWLFVANIPYGITSPLLRKLTELHHPPQHIIVLIQKEVAERLTAAPGNANRGLLTIQMEVAGKVEKVMDVPPTAFFPAPKVDSALVHIDLTQPGLPMLPEEKAHFFKSVAAGFSQKRKQIHNSLSATLSMPSDDVKHILASTGIDPNRRAETLSLQEWQTLSKALQNNVY